MLQSLYRALPRPLVSVSFLFLGNTIEQEVQDYSATSFWGNENPRIGLQRLGCLQRRVDHGNVPKFSTRVKLRAKCDRLFFCKTLQTHTMKRTTSFANSEFGIRVLRASLQRFFDSQLGTPSQPAGRARSPCEAYIARIALAAQAFLGEDPELCSAAERTVPACGDAAVVAQSACSRLDTS